MLKRRAGRIIIVGSGAAYLPGGTETGYTATKAAVCRYGETLRDRIPVFIISPGLVRTAQDGNRPAACKSSHFIGPRRPEPAVFTYAWRTSGARRVSPPGLARGLAGVPSWWRRRESGNRVGRRYRGPRHGDELTLLSRFGGVPLFYSYGATMT
jgi:NAD(P)-dependent dehydrogenase (short-subunit alcohol dehydrogenase family)